MDNKKIFGYEKEFLINLKKAYENYDKSYVDGKIADDFTYDSFWVFSKMTGADNYLSYLEGKLDTQKRSGYKCRFCLAKLAGDGKPILLLTPKWKDDYVCFVVDCNENGWATSLCIMPASFYGYKPDDIEEYKKFIEGDESC